MMDIEELHYELPAERIALAPAQPRDAARLMVIHRRENRVEHHQVRDLPALGLFRTDDLFIFNQSKVIPAYFAGTRAGTQGRVKGLYLESPDPAVPGLWRVLLEARGSIQPGETILLCPGAQLVLREKMGQGQWLAELESAQSTLAILQEIGSPPLPPYIRRQRKAMHLPEFNAEDAPCYNTVYASDPGSVAAPTAGLHFTPELLAALQAQGVRLAYLTLHVGMGTFAPVRVRRLEDHPIHSEWISIPPPTLAAIKQARARGSRIIPIGTTTIRALESLPAELPDAFEGRTNLFIYPRADQPAYPFRFADAVMTNFHLPSSTLLALIAALPGTGVERLLAWYRLAIAREYRFYSFGDAMLLV